jgi:hypothetical protein
MVFSLECVNQFVARSSLWVFTRPSFLLDARCCCCGGGGGGGGGGSTHTKLAPSSMQRTQSLRERADVRLHGAYDTKVRTARPTDRQ